MLRHVSDVAFDENMCGPKICYTTKTMFIIINKLSLHTGNIFKLQ